MANQTSSKKAIVVSVIILVCLIGVFIYLAGPEIAHTFKMEAFIKNPITTVLVLLAIGLVLRFFLIKSENQEYAFMAEAIVVAATIGLILEVPHIQSIFNEKQQLLDIAGEWIYTVTDYNGYITHGGVSTIEVKENEIYIYGHRKYFRFKRKLQR